MRDVFDPNDLLVTVAVDRFAGEADLQGPHVGNGAQHPVVLAMPWLDSCDFIEYAVMKPRSIA